MSLRYQIRDDNRAADKTEGYRATIRMEDEETGFQLVGYAESKMKPPVVLVENGIISIR